MSTYVFDTTHTNIGFVVRHAMITKVHGSFTDFDASFDPDAQTATATIKVNSLDTKNKDRDAHVLSGDFFDAENFPTMTFTATSTTLTSSNQGTVTGDLTIKGHTQPVTLDVHHHPGRHHHWPRRGSLRQHPSRVEATTTIT